MQNYKCKLCGAELFWNPDEGCLKCEYCESKYQPTDFEDATLDESVKDESIQDQYVNEDITEGMVLYSCKTCGGEVVALDTTMATICPYCGEAISITSKSVGNFRPDLLIPFSKIKDAMIEDFKKYVKRSFFTPKKFKQDSVIEKMQGLFVPFYLHSVTDHAKCRFNAEKTTTARRGDDRVTHHRVYDLAIISDGKLIRIPTDGAKKIDDQLMESLEPFNYSELSSYNPAYMAGFLAEQTDEEAEKMHLRAEVRAKEGMVEKAKGEFVGYTTMTIINEEHDITEHLTEYVMLPVWLLNISHNGKKIRETIEERNHDNKRNALS